MSFPPRRADTLFQDIWLPEETKKLRVEARQFAEDVLRPVAHRLNTTPESVDIFPREQFDALARSGLYQVPFPADVGGRGSGRERGALETALFRLTHPGALPMFRRNFEGSQTAFRERIAQPVEQLTFNQ